jgi:hypothetical protein
MGNAECGTRNAEKKIPARTLRVFRVPCSALGLSFGFGFAKAGDAVATFPLAAFFQKFDALKSFEDVAFAAESAGGAETTML